MNTISELQAHFYALYGLRDFLCGLSFEARSLNLFRSYALIQRAIRKGKPDPAEVLATFTCRFMSCINYFGGHLDLEFGVMEKYPIHGCAYCNHMPCDCRPDIRPEPLIWSPNESQRSWTIKQWQKHFQRTYGHNYKLETGLDLAFRRFVDEVRELSDPFERFSAISLKPSKLLPPEVVLQKYRHEAADVFNWILTVASVCKIDFQSAIASRYTTCPDCNESPTCTCSIQVS